MQWLCSWSQEERKTKKMMDQREKRGLQRTEYDITRGHTYNAGQESVESDHRWAADMYYGIAWTMKKIEGIFSHLYFYKTLCIISFIHSFWRLNTVPLQETTTQRRSQPSHGQKKEGLCDRTGMHMQKGGETGKRYKTNTQTNTKHKHKPP